MEGLNLSAQNKILNNMSIFDRIKNKKRIWVSNIALFRGGHVDYSHLTNNKNIRITSVSYSKGHTNHGSEENMILAVSFDRLIESKNCKS